jgi:DNA-binding SARP family transcriptional activator
VEFRILGLLEVLTASGEALSLGSSQQRAVLALLLIHAPELVTRDRLIDELWGERRPATAEHAVHVHVSAIRKILRADGGLDEVVLRGSRSGYVLEADPERVDARVFERLVSDAQHALPDDPFKARELLGEAIALWRGPALADLSHESFAHAEVRRLEELRLEGLELRIDADLALGRHLRLIGELDQLIAVHRFRERLRGQLMLALYRSGRQAEALEAYRAARTMLVGELGIEPSPALQQLERAILAQEPKLEPDIVERRVGKPLIAVEPANNLPAELTSLIGREQELDHVAGLIAAHRLVTVAGPGGVGKTRVAQRVARTMLDQFEHGVWFVDLAAIDESRDVGGTILSSVGIADQPGSAALDTVVGEFRERRALLVLDNCEHVLAMAGGRRAPPQ